MPNRDSSVPEPSPPQQSDDEAVKSTRRGFLLMGLAMLAAGCGPQRSSMPMPGPHWRDRVESQSTRPTPEQPTRPKRTVHVPDPRPTASNIIPRRTWASGHAVPARMNPLGSVRYITVHHDGMSPFYDTDERSTISRIDGIRRFHREHQGWGDIGYHYLIDRAGRIWEGREIDYQGAHVRHHNENNLAILLLGNFDVQSPSSAQLAALNVFLRDQMRQYRVPVGRVLTHREWQTARTICPGHALQQHMNHLRGGNALG